jgi:hypothetical protein
MNLLRGRLAYPNDRDLARVVRAAASRVIGKLESLDTDSLGLSPGTRRLLHEEPEIARAKVETCARVFAWSLPKDEKPFSDLTLVAFNDGLGLFSLLARECSVGTVVYHDSNDALRSDARAIAQATGSAADYYVFGEVEELEFVLRRSSIACDVLVSCDAADHVEELGPLLDGDAGFSRRGMAFGFGVEYRRLSTGATECKESPRANTISACCAALAKAGFELSVVRGARGGAFGSLSDRWVRFSNRVGLFGKAGSSRRDALPVHTFILCGSRRTTARPLSPRAAAPSPTARSTSEEILVS